MENQKIICVDCGKEEELSPGWVKLMAENPEIQLPKRCFSCRRKRKAQKDRESRPGNQFNRW